MLTFIPEPIINALSWTMFHSLWQGTLIALLLVLIFQNTSIQKAKQRYNYALASMFLFGILTTGTFLSYLDFSKATSSIMEYGNIIFIGSSAFPAENSWSVQHFISQYSDTIFRLWFIGVMLFTIKLLVGYGYLQYLKFPTNIKSFFYLNNILNTVQQKTSYFKKINIFASNKIFSPIVIGWIKPAILLPVSVVNNLTVQEIEAIIAHEIAHIIRHDWIVNILQSIMEVLFYFNPAIWWISAQIRKERENACDDWTLKHGYDKLTYAKLLYKVKEIQSNPMPSVALSFADSKNELMNRIQRILGNNKNQTSMKDKILAVALILFIGIGLAFTKTINKKLEIPFLSNSTTEVKNDRAIDLPRLSSQIYQDTIPRGRDKSTMSINQNGKSMTIEKEHGEITKMEIDGKVIDPSDYDKYMKEFGDFDFDHNGGSFKFHSNPGANFFNFNDGNVWKGFDEDRFGMMFKNLDSMQVFDFDNFSNHFRMDSLNGHMLGMEDVMEQLKESMKNLDFDNMEELKNFNFNHDFDFMKEFDFGQGFDFDFDDHPGFSSKSGKISDKIGSEMSRDGLLLEGEENEVELTGKHLKINGKKQSAEVYEKYKRIFEDYSGIEITKDSNIKLSIEGIPARKRGLRRI